MARKHKLPVTTAYIPMALLIQDTRDARLDRPIPLAEAQQQQLSGKLVSIDMGPAYPNAFMRREDWSK